MKNLHSETIVFGGGCFWCVEAAFKEVRGVSLALPGYSGGTTDRPSYEEVSTGTTGHAEVVKVIFDPGVITLEQLFGIFFSIHDPTSIDRQGEDTGSQYRSAIFYSDERQARAAEDFIKTLEYQKVFDAPVVTKIDKLKEFFEAEPYHHEYYMRNSRQPYCATVIEPKIAKFRKNFVNLLDHNKISDPGN